MKQRLWVSQERAKRNQKKKRKAMMKRRKKYWRARGKRRNRHEIEIALEEQVYCLCFVTTRDTHTGLTLQSVNEIRNNSRSE